MEAIISREDKQVAAAAAEFMRASDLIRTLQKAGRSLTQADEQRVTEAGRELEKAKRVRDLRKKK